MPSHKGNETAKNIDLPEVKSIGNEYQSWFICNVFTKPVLRTLPIDRSHYLLASAGVLLIAATTVITLISSHFALDTLPTEQPVILLVSLMIFTGIIYLAISRFFNNLIPSKRALIFIIGVGLALRIITIASTPILEGDYFRYLWDGAVLSKGLSPYEYSPEHVLDGNNARAIPPALKNLAKESGEIIHRINHPQLKTIYPPIAQSAFVIAHWLQPWSILSWRMVLLFFDIITLVLILRILRTLHLPNLAVLVYWWNPLLVKELFNSGHLDVIAFPFVLGSLLLNLRKNYLWSVVLLALSIGVKLWPIVLIPLVLRPLTEDPKRLSLGIGIFVLILATLMIPYYTTGIDESSALLAFGQSWQNNDSIFKILVWCSQLILEILGKHPGHGHLIARILDSTLIAGSIFYISSRYVKRPKELFEKSLVIIAAVFLLIPTQFPWYYTWMLPFLAVAPRPSLLLLTALLPLYYLRYYLEPRGMISYFDYLIVWIEFVPVWILLILEWRSERKAALTEQMRILT
ncbi:MAG: glycosyltransferase family 87 protein [Thermodesulfobacteriota bacterium]